LFVAVHPPPQVLAGLAAAVHPVRVTHPGLRWVEPERWHLTLAFLGEVPESRYTGAEGADLRERLARAAARHPPFELGVGGAGRFGDRVLWARPVGDIDRLRRLAASVGAAARRARIPAEGKPFRAHLTLATARPPASVRAAAAELDAGLRASSDAVVAPVTALHLVRSHLGTGPGRGPRYETVAGFSLGSHP
jgi:2'-5' RNA ligase